MTRERASDPATCDTGRLAWLSPAEPAAHALAGDPCNPAVRLDGDRVLFAGPSGIEAVSLGGARR